MPPTATSRHLRTHPVRLAAFDLGSRPPATAHVAEDPLRAYPAPLGDAGRPPLLRTGPGVALPRLRQCPPSCAVLQRLASRKPRHVSTPTRLAASGGIAHLMPYHSLRSPSAPPPMSASPVRASPLTGFRFPPCPCP